MKEDMMITFRVNFTGNGTKTLNVDCSLPQAASLLLNLGKNFKTSPIKVML